MEDHVNFVFHDEVFFHKSMLAPVSGRDLSVDNVLLLVFTLKFIRGVGDPGTSALASGLATEVLPIVEVFIEAALALKCNFFLFLLLT